jgi:hypothetical protein
MNRHANGQERLSVSIQREMGSEMTTRFFRSLPFFSAAEPLPPIWRQLLDRLDAQEGVVPEHVPLAEAKHRR